MAARTLIQFPATARRGEVIQVRVTISHGMETGYRPGMDGKPIPRDSRNAASIANNPSTRSSSSASDWASSRKWRL